MINPKEVASLSAMLMAAGATTFTAGKYSETVDSLVVRVAHAEHKQASTHDVMMDLYNRVVNIEKDVKKLVSDKK